MQVSQRIGSYPSQPSALVDNISGTKTYVRSSGTGRNLFRTFDMTCPWDKHIFDSINEHN